MGIVEVLSSGCGRSYRCSRRRRPGSGVFGRVGSHCYHDSLMLWLVLGKSEVVIVEATVYAAFGRRWVVAATVSSRLETLVSKRKTLWRLWSGKAGLSPSVGLSC
ncbi:hypothetical protein V6N13_028515 [Hibiscus sabdariffa]|uniref:Uncharacterized protein n=1 Tax=Hibiscus sabdariffa TaxID=183260 RepID=A0ABR2DA72_9ROSI